MGKLKNTSLRNMLYLGSLTLTLGLGYGIGNRDLNYTKAAEPEFRTEAAELGFGDITIGIPKEFVESYGKEDTKNLINEYGWRILIELRSPDLKDSFGKINNESTRKKLEVILNSSP